MRFTIDAVVLAALAISGAQASSHHRHSHARLHEKRAAEAAAIEARAVALNKMISTANTVLTNFGAKNTIATPDNGNANATFGDQGPYINVITNKADRPLTVVYWTAADTSFVSAFPPTLAFTLQPGESETVSIKEGVSGGLATIDPSLNEKISFAGQVGDAWIEYTTAGEDTTYDLSMLPNTHGRTLEVIGDGCTSNSTSCVFKCKGDVASCWEANSYDLVNCAPGSQPGANFGLRWGQPEGGCRMGTNAKVQTNLYA